MFPRMFQGRDHYLNIVGWKIKLIETQSSIKTLPLFLVIRVSTKVDPSTWPWKCRILHITGTNESREVLSCEVLSLECGKEQGQPGKKSK